MGRGGGQYICIKKVKIGFFLHDSEAGILESRIQPPPIFFKEKRNQYELKQTRFIFFLYMYIDKNHCKDQC